MAPRNRLFRAWLALDEVEENRANIGVLMGVGTARNLFVDWVTSGCPSYFEPLATAPPTVGRPCHRSALWRRRAPRLRSRSSSRSSRRTADAQPGRRARAARGSVAADLREDGLGYRARPSGPDARAAASANHPGGLNHPFRTFLYANIRGEVLCPRGFAAWQSPQSSSPPRGLI
jgi:hypothetical protein